ncbi:MAG: hypothetical protein GY816_15825 [Cytophagales bacterium]|nr:hypothetical protein [Cytophagales bacterium]
MKKSINHLILFGLIQIILCTTGLGQSKVQPYAGLYFSGDAVMYYFGPSYQLGLDIPLKGNFLVNGYGQYFSAKAFRGRYEVYTTGLMIRYNFGKKSKRWYAAIGLAYQDTKEESDFWNDLIDRSIILPGYRMGYTFFSKKYIFHPELFAMGPYSYHSGNSTELFTLPSVGIRVKRRPSARIVK